MEEEYAESEGDEAKADTTITDTAQVDTFYTHNGRIMVDGAEGETLCVFSVLGKLVANESLSAGVYMVKVGDYPVRKVVVIR